MATNASNASRRKRWHAVNPKNSDLLTVLMTSYRTRLPHEDHKKQNPTNGAPLTSYHNTMLRLNSFFKGLFQHSWDFRIKNPRQHPSLRGSKKSQDQFFTSTTYHHEIYPTSRIFFQRKNTYHPSTAVKLYEFTPPKKTTVTKITKQSITNKNIFKSLLVGCTLEKTRNKQKDQNKMKTKPSKK